MRILQRFPAIPASVLALDAFLNERVSAAVSSADENAWLHAKGTAKRALSTLADSEIDDAAARLLAYYQDCSRAA